jgi:hypothetical protein
MLLLFTFLIFLLLFNFSNYFFANYIILNMYYNDLLIITWVAVIVSLVFLNNKGWLSSILLYNFGVYQSFFLNSKGLLSLMYNNMFTYTKFVVFVIKQTKLFTHQIWIPLYRRGGYLNLLNSSRTRWHLSTSNNILKNK